MPRSQTQQAEPIPFEDVEITDEFWTPYLDRASESMLEHQYEQLKSTGCLDNFRAAAGTVDTSFEGPWFADSDAYKWIEAASYVLATSDDPGLRERVDEVIKLIASAQDDDGYLDTWIMLEYPDRRWTNLSMGHELYCAGHLLEAAVAFYRATDDESLLEVATAVADRIDDVFGPDVRGGTPGHEEIELGLVKLFRTTGRERYLELATYFINQRGRGELEAEFDDTEKRAGGEQMWEDVRGVLFEDGEYDGSYAQDHAPVQQQDSVQGHAVRAMYLYTALADLAIESGGTGYRETLEQLWSNMRTRRMYVTGGIGSNPVGERFSEDFDLPNETSYAETCASVGSIFWNHRMFQLTGDARFPELIERTLYNAFLVGVSPDLTEFFYANPHEVGPDGHALAEENPTRFTNERRGWFETACCPPNAARLLTSLGRYIYARGTVDSTIYVRQFIGSCASFTVGDTTVTLRQESELPWVGDVTIEVEPEDTVEFALRVRIPEWCQDLSASVNGDSVTVEENSDYLSVEREWDVDDELHVSFEMSPERLVGHPSIDADRGKVALRRGPVVYCLEGVDHDRPLSHYRIPTEVEIKPKQRPDFARGVTVLEGTATVPEMDDWTGKLYRRAEEVSRTRVPFIAIPYYAWANRDPGAMRVWLESEVR